MHLFKVFLVINAKLYTMKHKNIFFTSGLMKIMLAGSLLISTSVFGQKIVRQHGDFNKISLATGGYLEIVQGNEQLIELEGPQSVLDKVITIVDKNRLRIYSKDYIPQYGELRIYITVKELVDITVTGSGDVVLDSPLNVENINLEITGGGNIRIPEFTANSVEFQITGSGNITVNGTCKGNIDANITGSGNLKASGFEADNADINLTGSGHAEVFIINTLEGNIFGSGNIYYKGDPIINVKTLGPGKTKPL